MWIKLKHLTIISVIILFTVICLNNAEADISNKFRVASYNVENLFDLRNDGTEYADYVPGSGSFWNKKTAAKKYNNISKVITELSADIVGLQEIESPAALQQLLKFLQKKGDVYPFWAIAGQKSTVKCALISKYRIVDTSEIKPGRMRRSILRAAVNISGNLLTVYVNHWPSKKFPESSRLEYAGSLINDVKKLPGDAEYIILGDFNSNHNEFITIKTDRKLNDTGGRTGINHILKTVSGNQINVRDRLLKQGCFDCLYNLWMETDATDRWSYIYKKKKCSLDNMIVPFSLMDRKKIDLVAGSFSKYKPDYLLRGDYLNRWQISSKGYHRGRGFSDHLPVYADFIINSR